MVEEGLSSEAKALELRFASVVDAERARLLAIGEGHRELGQLGVGAVRGDETGDAVAPMPAAPLAADGERRLADVGQGQRAVAGHVQRGCADPTRVAIFPVAASVNTRPVEDAVWEGEPWRKCRQYFRWLFSER